MFLNDWILSDLNRLRKEYQLILCQVLQLLLDQMEVGKVILPMPFAGFLENNLRNLFAEQKWKILFLREVIQEKHLILLKLH